MPLLNSSSAPAVSPEFADTARADRLHSRLARVGRTIFPRRLTFGLVTVALTAAFMHGGARWGRLGEIATWMGLALTIAGFSLRAWASGCAGHHTRDETLHTPQLVTGGPFAHVRNPIYLGTAVLGLGVVGVLGEAWLVAPWALALGALYGAIIPAEERYLAGKFGDAYRRYCLAVPRLLPRPLRWTEAGEVSFRWSATLGELPLIAIVGAIIVGLKWLQTLHRM